MFAVIKRCGNRTYIDYYYNERFKRRDSALAYLRKMFKEQENAGSNPEWLNDRKDMFRYDFEDKKIYAYVGELK